MILVVLIAVFVLGTQAQAIHLYIDNDEEIVVLSGDGVRDVAEREVRFYKGLNDGYEDVRLQGRPIRANDFKLYFDKANNRYEIHLGNELIILVTDIDAQDHKTTKRELATNWFTKIRDSYIRSQPPLTTAN